MEIVLIGNNAQLIRSFHAVGERIYENDLYYIKPIQSELEAVFNPQKNNSFKKGEAVRFLLLGKITERRWVALRPFIKTKRANAVAHGVSLSARTTYRMRRL